MLDWYTQKIPYILHEFNTDLERGLSTDEANARGGKYGDNEVRPSHEQSLFSIFVRQFANLTTLLLFIVVLIHLYPTPALPEAVVIFSILCVHVLLRFIQEAKARRQLQTIKRTLEVSVSIIRDGKITKVAPIAVVPGDVLLLNEGDYIPADARIVDADDLIVDETPLFGTPTSAPKTAADLSESGLPPEKQTNMVFAGTYVLEGEGHAIIVGTGKELEINNPNRKVPVALDLDPEAEMQMGGLYDYFKISGLILGGIAVIAIGIVWRLQDKSLQENWQSLLFLGLSFAIASIPEGVVSTSRAILAENACKLLDKGIGICNLVNLERLSRVTAVCVDEIGNFTQEQMTTSRVFVDEQLVERETWEDWLELLDKTATDETGEDATLPTSLNALVPAGFQWLILFGSLCTAKGRGWGLVNQTVPGKGSIDDSLHQIAKQIGFDPDHYDSALSMVDELPQTPERPYEVLVFGTAEGMFLQIMFGQPEAVLQACQYIQLRETIDYMRFDQKQITRQAIQYLSDTKAQVFGVAYRSRFSAPPREEMRRNLTFLGVVAFTSLEYEDSRERVQFCVDAGLKVVMMTDRNRDSAADIAREFGIIHDGNAVVTQADLSQFSEEHYDSIVDRLLVYCHPSPEQKLNLVQYLKRHGHSVGFCGQSPRDFRAMHVADVSFASKSRSAPIVQQHADCLRLRNGFGVIADLLLHARESYSNLKSSMRWLLSCSLAQMITLFIGLILHLGSTLDLWRELPMIPLTLPQIIWVHLIVNLIPLLGLGYDRIQGDLKHNKPSTTPSFLSKGNRSDILLRSVVVASMTIFSFVLTFVNTLDSFNPVTEEARSHAETAAQTAACTTLIFTLLVSSLQCHRHFWESIFQRIKANIPLLIIISVCLAIHLLVVYLPPAQKILGTAPLLEEWPWILAFCLLILFLPLNLAYYRRSQ